MGASYYLAGTSYHVVGLSFPMGTNCTVEVSCCLLRRVIILCKEIFMHSSHYICPQMKKKDLKVLEGLCSEPNVFLSEHTKYF